MVTKNLMKLIAKGESTTLIHRDYTIAGGAVSLAIFDDRVEIWSAEKYPRGITPEALSRPHLSVQRNPIIAAQNVSFSAHRNFTSTT